MVATTTTPAQPTVRLPVLVGEVVDTLDRFRCLPYAATITVATCAARQRAAVRQRTAKPTKHGGWGTRNPRLLGDYALCRWCRDGRIAAGRTRQAVPRLEVRPPPPPIELEETRHVARGAAGASGKGGNRGRGGKGSGRGDGGAARPPYDPTAPRPHRRGVRLKCGVCNVVGHRRRSCPRVNPQAAARREAEEARRSARKVTTSRPALEVPGGIGAWIDRPAVNDFLDACPVTAGGRPTNVVALFGWQGHAPRFAAFLDACPIVAIAG